MTRTVVEADIKPGDLVTVLKWPGIYIVESIVIYPMTGAYVKPWDDTAKLVAPGTKGGFGFNELTRIGRAE